MSRPCYRVLVADDDPTVALLMPIALGGGDFAVTVVDNGGAAWAEFNQSVFDIVLLDVEMPEMDGFAVCAAIRRRQGGRRIPVVLISGRCDAVFVARVGELDAAYIAKPVDWSELPERLLSLLEVPGGISPE